jgi:hypothetical protein
LQACTDADRKAGDPRRSLVARYGSSEQCVDRLRVEADRLVHARLPLQEDADRYVAGGRNAL